MLVVRGHGGRAQAALTSPHHVTTGPNRDEDGGQRPLGDVIQ
jgi:hypothetical protein